MNESSSPPRQLSLSVVLDKVKESDRWRHDAARLRPSPPERHPTPATPNSDVDFSVALQQISGRRHSPISVTGQSLSPSVTSPSRLVTAKYFKLCQNLVKPRKTPAVTTAKSFSKKKKPRQSVSIRVVSKLKKPRSREPRLKWRPTRGGGLMLRKKVFPVHQKVISDPRQFARCDSDPQRTVNQVLRSKVMLIGDAYSVDKTRAEEVTADYLQNTYDFFHQRHVDNLKNMIAEHEQARDEFCQPEKKRIHIHEDFYCEMETEERPLSGSSTGSNSHEDIERLSETIDKCQINDKVKPKITFTHVSGPELKPTAADKSGKVTSPLLEVPSLFLDLSAEMLRPPLGNM